MACIVIAAILIPCIYGFNKYTEYDEKLCKYNNEVSDVDRQRCESKKMRQKAMDRKRKLCDIRNRYVYASNEQVKQLDKLYSQNVIYPKYRNWIAVATMYEYFDSGRCNKLTGPFGAYNMYESEVRANVIISCLRDVGRLINGNMRNQEFLKAQIESCKKDVANIMSQVESRRNEI